MPMMKKTPKKVVIYSTPTCPICHRAKEYLDKEGVTYQDINVAADKAAVQEMIKKSGQMGVPVILIDGEVMVGYNQARLSEMLAK
jgi:glutaredoxin-like YruB-family protein